MKIKLPLIIFLVLLTNLSCSLFFRDLYMFDQSNLQKAFAAFTEKESSARGTLVEIEITNNKVFFNTGTKKFVYSKGFLREDRFKYPSHWKNFRLDEIDVSILDKAMTAAIELAEKNPYMDKTQVSRIVINKQSVNRDDNLVSNVDKWRDAIRCEIYVADSRNESKYTANLQGEIVDVAATNVKPRIKFLDTHQMKKSLAEIKPLFGGKLSVSDLSIQIENFYFTALDPKNPDELNIYRFDSQEFLRAGRSLSQKTLQDKKREEEMLQSGMPEDAVKQIFPQPVYFDVDEIDFSLIPKVMQKTLENAKVSSPKISSITIRKRVDQFSKAVALEWRVETYGDRSEKESVTFDAQGNLKKTN